jgi:hypothetical protein
MKHLVAISVFATLFLGAAPVEFEFVQQGQQFVITSIK